MELSRWRCSSPGPPQLPYFRFDIAGDENIRAKGRPSSSPTTAATSTRAPLLHLRPSAGRPASSASGRCSTPPSWAGGQGMGGIPVTAPTGSDEPLQAATEALGAGRSPRSCPRARSRGARRSLIPSSRAAGGRPTWPKATQAPVIPCAVWGTEKVWPRSERSPRAEPDRPAPRARPVGRAGRSSGAGGRGRHQAHHGRHLHPAAARGPSGALRADGRRAGR